MEDVRFPVGVKLSEDYNFMLRIYENVNAAYINEPMVSVRRHDGNSYQSHEEMIMPVINALNQVKGYVMKSHRATLDRRLAKAWAAYGYHHYWNGGFRKATWGYFQSLAYPGRRINSLLHIVSIPLLPLIRAMRKK